MYRVVVTLLCLPEMSFLVIAPEDPTDHEPGVLIVFASLHLLLLRAE
jgi:hypothetical protein